jgi:hypothetical protein
MRPAVIGLLAAALVPACARAAATQDSALATWLAQNTDIAPSQVVIAGPEIVYSLEPLGPPSATGEVIAHVKTEAVPADWGELHGFRSWEAHVLFDCGARRLRVIRSASYPEHKLLGSPKTQAADAAWRSPEPAEPAAKLVAAACDADFAWPLRATIATAPAKPVALAAVPVRPPDTTAQPPASQPAKAYTIQLVRGPMEEGATRALAAARKILDAHYRGLVGSTEKGREGRELRYTAVYTGFPSPEAAAKACERLRNAGQRCLVRAAASLVPSGQPPKLDVAQTQRVDDAAPSPGAVDGFAIQVARGPIEEGAKRALERAQKTLQPTVAGLVGATEQTTDRGRSRYVAVLSGFASAEAAAEACHVLRTAGQTCLMRAAVASTAVEAPLIIEAGASRIATQAAQAQTTEAAKAAQAPMSAPKASYAVQVARGPMEDGAKRALSRAQKLLEPTVTGLAGATEETRDRGRRRYVAVLSGFSTPEAAAEACHVLRSAGQECLLRPTDGASGADPAPGRLAEAQPRGAASPPFLIEAAPAPTSAPPKASDPAAGSAEGPKPAS